MGETMLVATLALAYGPFALIVTLYVGALALKLAGFPGLLSELVERTKAPLPVLREPSKEQ